MSLIVLATFTYNSSALVGSEIEGTCEDSGGGFFKFAVKRAFKQGQIVHMEGKSPIFETSFPQNALMLSST